jgi:hypothetical protein
MRSTPFRQKQAKRIRVRQTRGIWNLLLRWLRLRPRWRGRMGDRHWMKQPRFAQLFQFRLTKGPCSTNYSLWPCLLEDVLDVLFAVATADGAITDGELTYLMRVSELFGFTETEFARLSAPYFPDRAPDPYTMLSVSIQASDDDIRKAWTRCVAENHPDKFIARGAPIEFIKAAHEKTAAINAAYEQIKSSRKQKMRPANTQESGRASPRPSRAYQNAPTGS